MATNKKNETSFFLLSGQPPPLFSGLSTKNFFAASLTSIGLVLEGGSFLTFPHWETFP